MSRRTYADRLEELTAKDNEASYIAEAQRAISYVNSVRAAFADGPIPIRSRFQSHLKGASRPMIEIRREYLAAFLAKNAEIRASLQKRNEEKEERKEESFTSHLDSLQRAATYHDDMRFRFSEYSPNFKEVRRLTNVEHIPGTGRDVEKRVAELLNWTTRPSHWAEVDAFQGDIKLIPNNETFFTTTQKQLRRIQQEGGSFAVYNRPQNIIREITPRREPLFDLHSKYSMETWEQNADKRIRHHH
jgi:hypothetical protein